MTDRPIAKRGAATVLQKGNRLVLVSYATPVLVHCTSTGITHHTGRKFSVTTSKHINNMLRSLGKTRDQSTEVTQPQLESMAR